MKTIALLNQKGGVGKTTIAINLAGYLSREHKVLLIDLDYSQSSAGLSLGFPRGSDGITISEILIDKVPPKQGIRKTYLKNLDIILSNSRLAGFDTMFKNNKNALNNVLKPLKSKYDYIILDCQPSFNLLSRFALLASDRLIIPVIPDFLSMAGLSSFSKEIIDIDKSVKILINMADYRTRNTNEIISYIRKNYKKNVFNTELKQTVKIREAQNWNKTIYDYSPRSSGAANFEKLGRELISWLN